MQVDHLRSGAERARTWMIEAAFPRWLGDGFDRTTGMFAERLGAAGQPLAMNCRLRVQARQIYACTEAAALGWSGDWRTPLEAGLTTLTERGRRPGGGFVHLFSPEGAVVDARSDLYDHAFALFALAKAAALLARPDLVAVAEAEWEWLDRTWAHPAGGYSEGEIASGEMRRQNPHMHLFEAALALHEADPSGSGLRRARRLAALFVDRFFDETHGALPEYFDDSWRPLAGDLGRVTEPGHQFEWAWLLRRYAEASGDWRMLPLATRLVAHGRSHGVHAPRNVAVNEVWIEGVMKTASARLWPQTERLKAAVSGIAGDPEGEAAEAQAALDGLFLFLDQPVKGAWLDILEPDGRLVEDASLASSLYHVACAVGELVRTASRLEDDPLVDDRQSRPAAAASLGTPSWSAEAPV